VWLSEGGDEKSVLPSITIGARVDRNHFGGRVGLALADGHAARQAKPEDAPV